MRIAVSYDNKSIFKHVGDTKEFKVYDVENGNVVSSEVLQSVGAGRGMVVDFLTKHSCDVLICNEICGGAKGAVEETGAKVYGAVTGNADAAVEALLRGELKDGDTVVCNHE
ncbi:MAG: NifB/NifX family molybdenum-iron cluster-binding protein [bacterium]|nr:NifB/NifX family molybdenum-iron cluster-binding protein [bacterium]